MSMWVFTHGICVVSRFPKFSPNLKITIECNRYFSGSAIPQRQILFGGDVDLFQTLNRSRTILSVLVHICAFASVVVACAYTFRALALVPFSFGALLGAIFYLVLLLIVWD